MPLSHQSRIERVDAICSMLRGPGTQPSSCHDVSRLLAALGHLYNGNNGKARQRAMQRDLRELVADGRIKVVNPGSRPLRYCRCHAATDHDAIARAYQLEKARGWIAEAVAEGDFTSLWRRLVHDADSPLLDESQVCLQSDVLRLRMASVQPAVLHTLVCGLAEQTPVSLAHRDAQGSVRQQTLHPLCLVERGSRLYVAGLLDAGVEPEVLAVDRIDDASQCADEQSRAADTQAASFQVDQWFDQRGGNGMIDLRIRVRGALREWLEACPFGEFQRVGPVPVDSPFDVEVSAPVCDGTRLLRWLLAGGDEVEVVAPHELRVRLQGQVLRMLGVYLRDA
jgi:proteasome accessory factor B